METEIPLDLTWGENRDREPGQVHVEWHAPCGCAFHPKPFPHVHPCSNEHKRPDLQRSTPGERVIMRTNTVPGSLVERVLDDAERDLHQWAEGKDFRANPTLPNPAVDLATKIIDSDDGFSGEPATGINMRLPPFRHTIR